MFDQHFRQATALWVVLWLLAPATTLAGSLHYTVATDARLEHLAVRACFEGSVPRRLIARDEHAPELLRAARLETEQSGTDHVYLAGCALSKTWSVPDCSNGGQVS